MRFVKKRYGAAAKSMKFPITLGVLQKMFLCLDGWPDLRAMSHEDRLFAAASVVGVLGMLRGGEFLWSRYSDRPLLKSADVVVQCKFGVRMLQVSIPRPKARWWLESETVLCLSPSSSSLLDPAWLVEALRLLAPEACSSAPDSPAFQLGDGSALTKRWLIDRTTSLLASAGLHFPDHLGMRVAVRAASWRAGGACTAKRAGVGDATIKHMGRWASNSFLRYTSAVELSELQSAVRRMGIPQDEGALIAQVGQALPAEEDLEIVEEIQAGVARLRRGARRAAGAPPARPAPMLPLSPRRRARG